MAQLFPPGHEHPYPAVALPEVYTALALRSRMGQDANGRTLLAEQREVLEEHGVTAPEVRDLWLSLWAEADGEAAAVRGEELDAIRDSRGH